jgi:hypothetical protein
MIDWMQVAVQVLGPGIPALCGLGVFGLKVLDRWDQRRAIERAMGSPEALKALQAIPEPSLLLDKAGPVALAFVLSGAGIGLVSAANVHEPHVAAVPQGQQVSESGPQSLNPEAAWRGQIAAKCDGTTCSGEGCRCVGDKCQCAVQQPDRSPFLTPPPVKKKPRKPSARADAGAAPSLDSTVYHPAWWSLEPSAFADRGPGIWTKSP